MHIYVILGKMEVLIGEKKKFHVSISNWFNVILNFSHIE